MKSVLATRSMRSRRAAIAGVDPISGAAPSRRGRTAALAGPRPDWRDTRRIGKFTLAWICPQMHPLAGGVSGEREESDIRVPPVMLSCPNGNAIVQAPKVGVDFLRYGRRPPN